MLLCRLPTSTLIGDQGNFSLATVRRRTRVGVVVADRAWLKQHLYMSHRLATREQELKQLLFVCGSRRPILTLLSSYYKLLFYFIFFIIVFSLSRLRNIPFLLVVVVIGVTAIQNRPLKRNPAHPKSQPCQTCWFVHVTIGHINPGHRRTRAIFSTYSNTGHTIKRYEIIIEPSEACVGPMWSTR